MTTKLAVIAPVTSIPGNGQVEFDAVDLGAMTVGELKGRIEFESDIPADNQDLWWRGYCLDNDGLPLIKALVGVNEGENVEEGTPHLVIFMTESPVNDKDDDQESSNSSPSFIKLRQRTLSFDMEKVRDDIRNKKENFAAKTCIIL
mmetsp:Transcript_4681/g.6940  ORF Transcript_4681/g.6940 Transcript_4681/m.6940 type:complete len:146 (-) Transcript_4681:129-566(-)